MTDEELQRIEALANRSTPDLQYGSVIDDDGLQKEDVVFSIAQGRVATLHGGLSLQTCDNGGFFTSARPDILALVAEVRRLQRVVDFHIKAHDVAETKREKYRRALNDASNGLPHDVWERIAETHGLEYAENTTGQTNG
jgi:hypothetical protein